MTKPTPQKCSIFLQRHLIPSLPPRVITPRVRTDLWFAETLLRGNLSLQVPSLYRLSFPLHHHHHQHRLVVFTNSVLLGFSSGTANSILPFRRRLGRPPWSRRSAGLKPTDASPGNPSPTRLSALHTCAIAVAGRHRLVKSPSSSGRDRYQSGILAWEKESRMRFAPVRNQAVS